MSAPFDVNRRDFLRTGLAAGGGLILGLYVSPSGRSARAVASTSAAAAVLAPNAFVRVGSDEMVTVVVNHSEMGQGVYTALPMLVAEELDADWSKVRFEAAPVDAVYNHTAYGAQMVGGSSSTWSEYERLRHAGATARAMLIAAAAESWGVEAATCKTENGFVLHPASSKRASYGSLAAKAATLPPPQNVPLKDPKDFKLIGKPTKRLDTPEKTNGKGVFGMDVSVPGMLVAVIARAPVFGGKVKSFDDSKVRSIPGVRHVVQIDRGVAVVADGYWPAHKGREALSVTWDDGPNGSFNTKSQREEYAALSKKPGAVAKKQGDAPAAIGGASKKIEAVYELPFLAHAAMEPLNCVADVRADSCEIWTGTQFQTAERMTAAQLTGFKPEQVKVHTTLLGGGFGRRAVADCHFVAEAVQVSKAIRAPVKVVWSREDDTRGFYYRPAALHSLAGAVDDAGNPLAWQQRIVCQSFMVGTPFEAVMVKDGIDAVAVEGAADLAYDFPNLLVDWQQAPGGPPTLWWRSVGHSHSAFAVESFIDELAHLAGKDPLEFRRARLKHRPRHLAALNLAAEKAGWGKPLPQGVGRGIAVHESFGSYVAHVAEVSVSKEGAVRVHRVVCAVDCGPTVNPDTITAQLEGAVVFGLSAALYGDITFENGRVRQRNYHDYPILRMNEMPVVESYIVPSTEKMGGIGEPGVPPIAPALANAIFNATGKRIRRLPIQPGELKSA